MNFIRLEEIYDAATDDDCFDQLALRFADMVGARSGVVHWRRTDDSDGAHEVSHTGYFAPEHMEAFDRDFTGQDLWSTAVQAENAVNRVWDCEDLVPRQIYENSSVYNDWVRQMGDDSFFAVGAALRTRSVVAEIGFHRGKGQGKFAPESVALLNSYAGHLARALGIRERIRQAEMQERAAKAGLDVLGYGVFTLSTAGRILHHNAAAEAMLQQGHVLKVIGGKLCATSGRDRAPFAAAVEAVAEDAATAPVALTLSGDGKGGYEVSIVSLPGVHGRSVMVVVKDTGRRDGSLAGRLKSRYGLSAAEAEIAVRLSEGVTAKALAEERQTAHETVRAQIKSIAAKLRCSGQIEIVAAIKDLPPLSVQETA